MQVAGQSYRTPVFYVPGTHERLPLVIDLAEPLNGVLVGSVNKEPLEEVAKRYPGAALGELDVIVAEKERRQTSEPEEISLDAFISALEVLPPDDWQRHVHSESFKMCERLSGRITGIYVRLNEQYFSFADLDTITHDEAVEKVIRWMRAKGASDERS